MATDASAGHDLAALFREFGPLPVNVGNAGLLCGGEVVRH
jgi:hypothetical protein